MLDFTSAHYLGLRHDHVTVGPWSRLSAGVPSALAEPDGAEALSAALATWLGVERVTLLPSTLHLFWDFFGVMMDSDEAIYWDEGTYAVARWGVERARALGTPTTRFAHHDVDALRRALLRERGARRPVVVTDGFCPGCARHAPLGAYHELVRAVGGRLVVDDTQALGLLGAPARGMPYGRGGAGVLGRFGLAGADVLVGASLAKSFGAPLALLAGARSSIQRFEARSDVRVHCSPASVPVVAAASRALALHTRCGAALRQRLADNVRRFTDGLRAIGHASVGASFPVQRVSSVGPAEATAVHAALLRRGVRTILQRPTCTGVAAVTYVLTASHTHAEVDAGIAALARVSPRVAHARDTTTIHEGGRSCVTKMR